MSLDPLSKYIFSPFGPSSLMTLPPQLRGPSVHNLEAVRQVRTYELRNARNQFLLGIIMGVVGLIFLQHHRETTGLAFFLITVGSTLATVRWIELSQIVQGIRAQVRQGQAIEFFI